MKKREQGSGIGTVDGRGGGSGVSNSGVFTCGLHCDRYMASARSSRTDVDFTIGSISEDKLAEDESNSFTRDNGRPEWVVEIVFKSEFEINPDG
mgnify:CR=1 FL=1